MQKTHPHRRLSDPRNSAASSDLPNLCGNHLSSVWLDYDGFGTISETDIMRAALYLRVSTTDGQTTENQRMALARVAAHRGWEIVQTYEDAGISGAKGRDQRPAFNQMLKDAVRRRFDVLMVWSIDRLGRSVLHVASRDGGNGCRRRGALFRPTGDRQ